MAKKKNSNNKFNTKLNPIELESFNKHAGLFSSLLNDKVDYDTQGFYKDIYNTYKGDFNAITTALTPGSETEHIGFDKYKKPNHPTFSKESKYYIPLLRNAGTWEDNYFNAANRNIRNMNKGYGSPMNYMQWAEDYDANGVPDVGLKQRGKILIEPEQKAMGGMIKRKDGSYSQRGLWDNIRANKGSGKKPTKEMLAQEKKIKKKMAVGGLITNDMKNNKLPKMWAGGLTPTLFDVGANALMNLTSYAVTDMIKAIKEPKPELRPTKQNTGFTMATGGVVDGDPTKPTFSWGIGNAAPITPQILAGSYNSPISYLPSITPSFENDGTYIIPEVEVLARNSDENFQKELKAKKTGKQTNVGKNIKKVREIENWLGDVATETALDQVPYLNIPKALYAIQKGRPLTGLTEFIKTYGDPRADALINSLQDNPSDFDAAYIEDTYIPELQLGKRRLKDIGKERLQNKSLPALDKAYKQFGVSKKEFVDFINQNMDLGRSYEQALGDFKKQLDYQKGLQETLNNFATEDKYGTGGTIHIKPSKRGTFTAAADKRGMGVQEFASKVLANKDNYSSAMVKKANFAKNAAGWKHAFGGIIDPSMYMQQMMYGSYAQGGQVPQNIPVEVEGQEMYQMPNGQMGEFQGPSHENGGIPVALPEGTKVYSDRLKVNGKTMADRKDKRERNIAKLEKLLGKTPHDKFLRQSLERQKETAALEEQSDMAMQEQANQQQAQQEQAMMQEQAMAGLMQDPAMMQQMGMMAMGGYIPRLDNGTPPGGLINFVSPSFMNMVKRNSYNPFTQEEWNNILNNKPYELPIFENTEKQSFKGPLKGEGRFPLNNQEGQFTFGPQLDLNLDLMNDYFDQYNETKRGGTITGYSPDQEYPFVITYPTETSGNQSIMNYGENKFPQVNLNTKTSVTEPEKVSAVLNSKTKVADTNPLDFRENVGVDVTKPEPLGVNPYNVMNDIMGNTFGNIALSKDPYINSKGVLIPNPLYNEVIGNKMLLEEDPKKPNKFMNFLNNAVDQTGDFFSGLFDKNGKPKKDKGTKSNTTGGDLDFTRGDYMGLAGNLYGGVGPMMGTFLNRMETPKNVNFFREFGAEGLRAMQEAQALAAINRDKQLADIKLGEEAGRQRGRNSARGVNTLRALDIAADMGANQAQNQAYNAYAQQMMQLLGQKAQMENQQDQMVMQGETARDLADRQDIDNFYTNLVQNLSSQSELMQKTGRDLNTAQYNKMLLNMSPLFSRYGIGFKMKDGNLVAVKDGKTVDERTLELIIQKEEAARNKVQSTVTSTIPFLKKGK